VDGRRGGGSVGITGLPSGVPNVAASYRSGWEAATLGTPLGRPV